MDNMDRVDGMDKVDGATPTRHPPPSSKSTGVHAVYSHPLHVLHGLAPCITLDRFSHDSRAGLEVKMPRPQHFVYFLSHKDLGAAWLLPPPSFFDQLARFRPIVEADSNACRPGAKPRKRRSRQVC